MYYWCVALAFFALSRVFLTVADHRWPVVTMPFDLDGQGSSSRMVTARAALYFLHNIPWFSALHAEEKGTRESPLEYDILYQNISRGLSL